MKRLLLFTSLLAAAVTVVCAQESDEQVQARKVALELAGAFSNDGFKIRDGHWTGPIKQGDKTVVAVNLYAGNQYWFSVGANQEVQHIAVQVHDEHGKPMPTEAFQGDDKAAAGFSPTISGQYFVSIAPPADASSTYCLVYSYK
ncbi:MAG: hypothetical protein H0V56_08110 [Chthoniobacterales bacterium]|nr:hypothetical protein [Chthoniobacterales bacterium]